MADTSFDPGRTPWLHIRSQFTYHAESDIRGTVAGLTSLRDTIDAALATGRGEGNACASDGEGYEILVSRVSTVAGLGRPTYLNQEARELAYHELEYLVREDKMIRKQNREALEALRWCRQNGNPHQPIPHKDSKDG